MSLSDRCKKVLFISTCNSVRSQMAEAFLNHFGKEWFIAGSAGIDPTDISRETVQSMKELDIDLTGCTSKTIFKMYHEWHDCDYLISVCSSDSRHLYESVFPFPRAVRINWNLPSTFSISPTEKERMDEINRIRDLVKEKIEVFIRENTEDDAGV